MEAIIRDDVSGKRVRHEVSETATAGELLQEACRLFGREELDSALEVDGAVVCTGVVGGVSGGEASVGSLGVHSDSSLVLCRSRDRVLAKVAEWPQIGVDGASLPAWAWDDEVVVLALAVSDINAFEFVSERLRTSDSFMRDVVERVNCLTLEYASAELRSDRELVLAAVAKCGWVLRKVSEELKADKEVVLAAVAEEALALRYARESLRDDKGFMLAAVAKRGLLLEYASKAIRANRKVVLTAVATCGRASLTKLRSDKQVVLAAVAEDAHALRFASGSLRSNKGFMLTAVAQRGLLLQYASNALQANREVVQIAVAQDGLALQHASTKLRADKQVVSAAVAQNAAALDFASDLSEDDDLVSE